MGNLLRQRNTNKFILGLIYIYFFAISFMIIPSGDDYFWWGKSGIYLLHHNFFSTNPNYGGSSNGRYLGNILEISMMHSPIFAGLIYAGVITLFIWCIWQLTGKKTLSLIMSSAIFIIIQSGYIRNVFFWFAGFSNYLPPITLLLLFCVLFERYVKTKHQLNSLIYFLIAIMGGLFVEHMTLYQVFVGIISIIFIIYFNKLTNHNLSKKPAYYYSTGAILSGLIMFTHPSYYQTSGSYRQVASTFDQYIRNYVYITHFWMVTFNYVVIILIASSIIGISIVQISNIKLKYTLIFASILFIAYYLFINIYIHFNCSIDYIDRIHDINRNLALLDSVAAIFFYIYLIASVLIIFKGLKYINIYFYLFSSIALFIPFMFILSPIFVREYFSSFVFLFILCVMFLNKAISLYEISFANLLHKALAICVACAYLIIMFMTVSNYHANLKRVNDPNFLYSYKMLKYQVPYPDYVSQKDMLIMQSPTYWKGKLSFKLKDYFYNGQYK
ncbi:DUF6056 family protein [Companilactobacillus huachuanensis]|uniref:DUF6056 family protein n=1 Tax=Companilactobacillus huachuanensis TaxID=2559914 RepID=A0ABW1RI40_9LACO|nr:DUF6056 family protein [Companilactobacillus huachuanensis]